DGVMVRHFDDRHKVILTKGGIQVHDFVPGLTEEDFGLLINCSGLLNVHRSFTGEFQQYNGTCHDVSSCVALHPFGEQQKRSGGFSPRNGLSCLSLLLRDLQLDRELLLRPPFSMSDKRVKGDLTALGCDSSWQ